MDYKGAERKYDVYRRPLWKWAVSMLEDPNLAPHMEWEARKLYKWTNDKWMRFVDEPWTTDNWWNIQVC